MENNKIEIIKLNKSTVQALAAYLGTKPYSEVADIANTLVYEANNQKIFEAPIEFVETEEVK